MEYDSYSSDDRANSLEVEHIKRMRKLEVMYKRIFSAFPEDTKETIAAKKIILEDLMSFCNAGASNFSPDALQMARMEGRREVFNRIFTFNKMDISILYQHIVEKKQGEI